MNAFYHCPYRQSTLLQQALAPDKMRIAFLLGAGCPKSILVPEGAEMRPLAPDIRGLTDRVNECLSESAALKGAHTALLGRLVGDDLSKPTIEDILSEVRALQNVVREGCIDGLDKGLLSALDVEICEIATNVLGVELPSSITPYHQLAMWIGGIQRTHPIELFTPNYDLLVEQALEARKIPYFDGFVGSKRAFFDLTSMENDVLPPRWCRVWKVHGSINWWRMPNDDVVRCDTATQGGRKMIYPSHLKYDQSRRMPYLAMLDRLRAFLARGQAVLVTSGYSFADQHLNEVILHGLRSNPTAICFGLLYGNRSDYKNALDAASTHHNLSLLAADGAVLGTIERAWQVDELADHPMHGISVDNGYGPEKEISDPKTCNFVLGDFARFGVFLARQLSHSTEDVGTRSDS